MELKQIKVRTKVLTLDLGPDPEDKLTIHYRPGAVTQDNIDALTEGPSSEGFDRVVEFMLSAIASWDITQDGKPYDVTAENVRALDIPFINMIQEAIVEDNQPKRSR